MAFWIAVAFVIGVWGLAIYFITNFYKYQKECGNGNEETSSDE